MLLVLFCLRLAVGMLACLLLLRADTGPAEEKPTGPRQMTDRVGQSFFRTHFLVTLALACVAALWIRQDVPMGLFLLSFVGVGLSFVGSLSWSLEGAPGGRALIVLTVLTLGGSLVWLEGLHHSGQKLVLACLGDASAAGLLGAAMTAMLLGHSYLIAPSLSTRPLNRLVGVLALALAGRMVVDGCGLWWWSINHEFATAGNDVLLWLPVRWVVGLVGPLILCWMAWQTARIRSTQSATGILYVVVIFCFLGELTGQLLRPAGLVL